jgi:hypothetical protein
MSFWANLLLCYGPVCTVWCCVMGQCVLFGCSMAQCSWLWVMGHSPELALNKILIVSTVYHKHRPCIPIHAAVNVPMAIYPSAHGLVLMLSWTKKNVIVVVSVNSVMWAEGWERGERGKDERVGQLLPDSEPGWIGIRHHEQEREWETRK